MNYCQRNSDFQGVPHRDAISHHDVILMYYNLEFLERNVDITSQHTMEDLFDSYDRNQIHSTPGVQTDSFHWSLDQVKITDFFGNVQSLEIGGEGQVIDQDLLGQQKLNSQHPKLEGNNTVIAFKRDTLEEASHGFEVKVQARNVWIKGVSIIACIILWIVAKKML